MLNINIMRSLQSYRLFFTFLPTGASHLNVLGFYVPDISMNMGPILDRKLKVPELVGTPIGTLFSS
jgi:hypothetical protein